MNEHDLQTIQELRSYDRRSTLVDFYDTCRSAYKAFDYRHHISHKAGLDFYSLAHDYYIQLVSEDFASLLRKPDGITLRSWMYGAFRYVILNALRAHNREYDHLDLLEADQIASQMATLPSDRILHNIVLQVQSAYSDPVMTQIAQQLFVEGYPQNEVAQRLGITPSAVSQRRKRMMDEVVIPYVYSNYPHGIAPQESVCYSIIREGDGALYRMCESRPFIDRTPRTTPDQFTLCSHYVVVVNSTLEGRIVGLTEAEIHQLGADGHKGIGAQRQAYLLPTLSGSPDTLAPHVKEFVAYAASHPMWVFMVTDSIFYYTGYRAPDLAPLFRCAESVPNIKLPKSLWNSIDDR